jgi:hypothetical protein
VILVIPRTANQAVTLPAVCIEALSYIKAYPSSKSSKIGSTSAFNTSKYDCAEYLCFADSKSRSMI